MTTLSSKLEKCEVCAANKAKYTCPKCEVRTCCLGCINIHKKELDCDGIRDKTKFISLNTFTDLDLLSDYRLLEEVGRSVDQLQRDPSKRYTRQSNLPVHLNKLKTAVKHRRTKLEFLPQNFSRHKENTTYLKWSTNELFWRVEWIFPQAENTKWVDDRLLESERLSNLVEKVIDPIETSKDKKLDIEELNVKMILSDRLQFYRAAGLPGIKVLLKAEMVQKSDTRFYELDVTLTLKENLEKKTIIEFPTLYVILRDHLDMYEIIDSDEEQEVVEKEKSFNNSKKRNLQKRKYPRNQNSKQKEEGPVNFFFDTALTDSEDEQMHERRNYPSKLNIPEYNDLVKMEH
ncbi:box C/D snoRNA protein 1 [Cephus cinctus]|uniref:Box C/D snoRNA protein 1 n=1 Tax=Cephus cinctus TaxID=211228 RepID=A0AAJ7C1J2_CEPCN|nr:box C/D snoRNA protein 1 [Cephus cinctus]